MLSYNILYHVLSALTLKRENGKRCEHTNTYASGSKPMCLGNHKGMFGIDGVE